MRPTPVRPIPLPTASSTSSSSPSSSSPSVPSTPPDASSPFSPRPPPLPPRPPSRSLSASPQSPVEKSGGAGSGSGSEGEEGRQVRGVGRKAELGRGGASKRPSSPASVPSASPPPPSSSASSLSSRARQPSKRPNRSPLPLEAQQPSRVRALSAAAEGEAATRQQRGGEEGGEDEGGEEEEGERAGGAFQTAVKRTALPSFKSLGGTMTVDVNVGEGGPRSDESSPSSSLSALTSPIASLSLTGEPSTSSSSLHFRDSLSTSSLRMSSVSSSPLSSQALPQSSPSLIGRSSKTSLSSVSSPLSPGALSRRPSAFSSTRSISARSLSSQQSQSPHLPASPSSDFLLHHTAQPSPPQPSTATASPLESPLSSSRGPQSRSPSPPAVVPSSHRREARETVEGTEKVERTPKVVTGPVQGAPISQPSSRVASPHRPTSKQRQKETSETLSARRNIRQAAPPVPSSSSPSSAASAAPPPFTVPARSSWFRLDTVHRIERRFFPEFFPPSPPTSVSSSGSASPVHSASSPTSSPPSQPPPLSRTGQQYKDYRDWMLATYRRHPSVYLCFTTVRRYLHGDFGSLYKIYQFLETWELLNYRVDDSTRPQVMDTGATHLHLHIEPSLRRPVAHSVRSTPHTTRSSSVSATPIPTSAATTTATSGGAGAATQKRGGGELPSVPVVPLGPPRPVVRPTAVSLPLSAASTVPLLSSSQSSSNLPVPPFPSTSPPGLPLRPVAAHPSHSHSVSMSSLPPLFPTPQSLLPSAASFSSSPSPPPLSSVVSATLAQPPLLPGRFVAPVVTAAPHPSVSPLLPPLSTPIAPLRPTPILAPSFSSSLMPPPPPPPSSSSSSPPARSSPPPSHSSIPQPPPRPPAPKR